MGDLTSVSQHETYKVNIHDGSQATISRVCLDKITSTFPTYSVQGRVINDIISAYQKERGGVKILPIIPNSVGGKTDFVIGIKFLRYHPKFIFHLPSCLPIYESVFQIAD